ncbi:hypothetical protein GcM3_097028 [Golovinomyces cichoracearum]|uniref:Uncharacterized protein n=1 Tax=Golovinomyces cichoracearum TaxID=62708 RepID=A0A420IDJ6_9PEZI|nr:hypothetical protein GcM3_097028 [Golovinomyces cichoracearum]
MDTTLPGLASHADWTVEVSGYQEEGFLRKNED